MDDVIARAKARIGRMKQVAKETTEELGFPPEAESAVLLMMFGAQQEAPASAVSPVMPAPSDASLKNLIYQHAETFFNQRMKKQVRKFNALWEGLKQLPVETLVGELGQLQTAGGLGFAEGSQDIIAVVSTVSWVVVQAHDPASRSKVTEQQIVQEALARGCSVALSHALAHYLHAHLSAPQ